MSFDALAWLFVFILQASLLGKCVYTLTNLEDLKNDHINPWDCAQRVNKFLVLEGVIHVILSGTLILAQKWFAGLAHAALTAYLIHLYLRGQLHMHTADAYKQLEPLRQLRFSLFIFHCISFLFVAFRLMESIIHTVLTPEGRVAAKKLFQEAVTSIHGI